MRHGVLDDERLDPVRMRQSHAKADRTAVVLHVQRVARETERLGEAIHDLGEVIERIRELFRIGPVAVSETRIVRRDQVIPIGQPREQRLEHPG